MSVQAGTPEAKVSEMENPYLDLIAKCSLDATDAIDKTVNNAASNFQKECNRIWQERSIEQFGEMPHEDGPMICVSQKHRRECHPCAPVTCTILKQFCI